MRPWVGLRNLVRRLKQVVLPAPFGPINAWIVPRSTWRFTPLTATKPANSLVRSSVARIVWLPIRRDNSPCPGPIYGGNGRIVQYRDGEIGAGIAQQLAGATKFGCRPARGLRSHHSRSRAASSIRRHSPSSFSVAFNRRAVSAVIFPDSGGGLAAPRGGFSSSTTGRTSGLEAGPDLRRNGGSSSAAGDAGGRDGSGTSTTRGNSGGSLRERSDGKRSISPPRPPSCRSRPMPG